jgi:hypothetical protein
MGCCRANTCNADAFPACGLATVRIPEGQRLLGLSKNDDLERGSVHFGRHRSDFFGVRRVEAPPFCKKMALPNGRKGYPDSGQDNGHFGEKVALLTGWKCYPDSGQDTD